MDRRLEILITNDDGANIRGIDAIQQFMRSYGNVYTVAPMYQQSGKSAALSLGPMMHFRQTGFTPAEGDLGSLTEAVFEGTPADCVKFGINKYFSLDRLPDLIISGINHGSNASVASIYSGTLGAALEGTAYGIPSIGLSVDSHCPDADMDAALHYAAVVLENFFANPPRKGVYLNVNVPDLPLSGIKGIRLAHQGKGRWVREFVPYIDPHGGEFFIMGGEFQDLAQDELDDHRLVAAGYVAITPMLLDNTDYAEMNRLSAEWNL